MLDLVKNLRRLELGVALGVALELDPGHLYPTGTFGGRHFFFLGCLAIFFPLSRC